VCVRCRRKKFTFAISSPDEFLVWFFCQPTGNTRAPVFTLNTANDVYSRKHVPSGGLENKILYFKFSTPFSPKTEILGQFLTGLRTFRLKRALTMLNAHLYHHRHRSSTKVSQGISKSGSRNPNMGVTADPLLTDRNGVTWPTFGIGRRDA